jgi:hypothetical protein
VIALDDQSTSVCRAGLDRNFSVFSVYSELKAS